MVNSTWTKNHVDAVLDYAAKDTLLATIHSIIVSLVCNLLTALRTEKVAHLPTRIVYPPCDTKQMSAFQLTGRSRLVLSLAQFRYEIQKSLYWVGLTHRIVQKKTMLHNCAL